MDELNNSNGNGIGVVKQMMNYVINNVQNRGNDMISIDKSLTDKYEPSYIFDKLHHGCTLVDLRKLIDNPNNSIGDIAIIRIITMLISIINKTNTDNNVGESMREMIFSSDKFTYDYTCCGKNYTLPSHYIEELEELLNPKTDYNLSKHTGILISNIGYTNLGLFLVMLEYIIDDD